MSEIESDTPLWQSVNTLLLSERGGRGLPLKFYTKERLFSVAARRNFIEPDLLEWEYI